MSIHASDFGYIALTSSAVFSILIFIFVLKLSKRLTVHIKHSAFTFFSIQICIFAPLIVVPIAVCIGTGYSLHWLHHFIKGPFTYGSSGYEAPYEYFTQLLILGFIEFFLGVYFSFRNLSTRPSTKIVF